MKTYKILFIILILSLSACGGDDGNTTGISPQPEILDPEITGIEPSSGAAGTVVTISGSEFSSSASDNVVTFNGVLAEVTGAAENQLTVQVPEGASDGTVKVRIGEVTSTGPDFNFIPTLRNKILFRGNPDAPDGDYDIYMINPDGSKQQKLFDNDALLSFPALSHDGTKIVYRRMESDGSENDLFVANTDGSAPQQLSDLSDYAFTGSWSPDNTKIVFSNGTEDDAEIYVVNTDGSNLTQITDDAAWNRYPQWSPDGERIAFGSNRDGDFEIYTMDIDGSDVKKVTDDSDRNTNAKWSPDGTEFIFTSNRDGIYGDVYRMNVDGSNVRRITTENGGASAPDWSPDGSKIVFEDNRDLFIINADGSGEASQITNNPNTNRNFFGCS